MGHTGGLWGSPQQRASSRRSWDGGGTVCWARLSGGAAAATVVDDLGAGQRWLRSLLPKRTTSNVVAVTGDVAASRTLVVVAHHDAAHSGMFFNPRLTAAAGQHFPPPPGKKPRQVPTMAVFVAAPAVSGLAALAQARGLLLLGTALGAGIIASLTDIAVRPAVPGANDNLNAPSPAGPAAGTGPASPPDTLRTTGTAGPRRLSAGWRRTQSHGR